MLCRAAVRDGEPGPEARAVTARAASGTRLRYIVQVARATDGVFNQNQLQVWEQTGAPAQGQDMEKENYAAERDGFTGRTPLYVLYNTDPGSASRTVYTSERDEGGTSVAARPKFSPSSRGAV